jgi:hypothetical protein
MNQINISDSLPSLFSITNDEIETVIPSESNEHISKKISKKSSCGLNYKVLIQFTLMIIQLIFKIFILIKEYNKLSTLLFLFTE